MLTARRIKHHQIKSAAELCDGLVGPEDQRIGNQDEAQAYVLDFMRWLAAGDWIARDGFNYADGAARIRVPVAAWVGAADRLFSPPRAADAFVKLIDQSKRARIVGRATGLPFDPGHMELVTDARCRPVWDEVASFCGLVQKVSD